MSNFKILQEMYGHNSAFSTQQFVDFSWPIFSVLIIKGSKSWRKQLDEQITFEFEANLFIVKCLLDSKSNVNISVI